MKKIFLLFVILFLASDGYSQPCPTSNMSMSSQAQIDSFPMLYARCNVIDSVITIGSESSDIESDITNLNGLPSIECVKSLFYNLGQKILSKEGKNGINELDIKGIMPGIYFVGLKNGKQLIKASKVIIQK